MYKTILENTTFELTEKKSKFIANLYFVQNKGKAETIIKEVQKKYHDARHNCFAYRILQKDGVYERASDDRGTIRNCRSSDAKYFKTK